MMTCFSPVPFLLVILLIAALTNIATSQAMKIETNGPSTFGEILFQVIDSNKDDKVTMEEVSAQINILTQLFQNAGNEEHEENEYLVKIEMAKVAAPHVFELLDSNGDKSLSESEFAYTTNFENSLKKGGKMKDFVRNCFKILDVDGDDQVSLEELISASEALPSITVKFHEIFPLRPTAKELESFVQSLIFQFFGEVKVDKESVEAFGIMSWLDDDGDGFIQKKEVGKAYNAAGKKIMEAIKNIKKMGPMLAMFGGQMPGGGGMNNMMGDEF